LRRGWREAPGDAKPRRAGFLAADPTPCNSAFVSYRLCVIPPLCHSERSEESDSSADPGFYSTYSNPRVIPSAARNLIAPPTPASTPLNPPPVSFRQQQGI